MEYRESSERKSLFIKTLLIIIILLLAFLSSILYVFLYPKTQVLLYDSDYNLIDTLTVKRYSKLNIPEQTKPGYTFSYWSYDDFKGEPLDTEKEVEDEVVKLYANYNVNQYKVTYYVRTKDPVTDTYYYNTNVPGCLPIEYDYGTTFQLPTGRIGGNLIPELQSMFGFHFVGWTTIPISEDNVNVNDYLYYAGSECTISTPGDLNFYAYWEKNTYDVYMHNGIAYEMELDGVTPKKDASGKPIIKNILDDIDNEKNSYVMSSIRYLDYVTDVSENFLNITLDAKNGTPTGEGTGYTEYDFVGWYLDEDYTIAANNHLAEVRLDGEQPYLLYYVGTESHRIDAELTGLNNLGEREYAFHLYSKWVRRAYNVTFNKNANGSSGKLDKIELYRYDDEYGKYYDNGNFSREGYASGKTYTTIDFLELFATEEFDKFANSYTNYRLIGLCNEKSSKTEGATTYYWWKQDKWNETLLTEEGNKVYNVPVRDNSQYVHAVSENITLYAQWSRIYTITFAYASGQNQKQFKIQGIQDEWFWLPDADYITQVSGSMWTKEHNTFAGWRSATNSLDIRKLLKEDKSLNANYYYEVGKSNETFYVYWTKTPYTITFYKNDGTEDTVDYPICYGNDVKVFPTIAARPGYIFNGWSLTKYGDNEYAKAYREKGSLPADQKTYSTSSTFTVKGNTTYYATWTTDYIIEYDPNMGVFNGSPKTTYKYSDLITNKTNPELKANMYVGRAISLSRDNYTFVGWQVKIDDSTVSEHIIYSSSTKSTTFDFLDKVYYPKPATSTTVVPDSSKNPLYIIDGNKVVLVAKWEPVKYTVTIVDTKVESSLLKNQQISVAFNEEFTFPITNKQGGSYDNKVGYRLVGFSTKHTTDAASVEYPVTFTIVDGERVYDMPVIPANTLTSNITFYTIYIEQDINLSYWIEHPSDKTQVSRYTPSGSQYLSGALAYGTIISALPTPASSWHPTNKYSFKYWFYYDEDGNQVEFSVGDKLLYSDEDGNLKLFAKFELEEYVINIIITNPYSNNATLKTINSAFVVEKGIRIENDFMTSVDELLNSEFALLFGDNFISNGILKGYTFANMGELNYRENVLAANKTLTSSYFEILKTNPATITFVTMWNATNIALTYTNKINGTTYTDSLLFGDKTAKTAPNNTFDFSATNQYIGSWDINGEGELFIACDSYFVDGSLLKTYNDLMPYITWRNNGSGTLELVANTEQICQVYYYTDDGNAKESQVFTLGQDVSLIDGNALMTGDFKFAGWYYNGELITSIPELTESNGFTAHIYADKTLDITYRNITFVGSGVNYNNTRTETVNLLEYEGGTFTYKYEHLLSYYPEQTELNGYVYYGLTDNVNIYSIADIDANKASVILGRENIILDVCLCKEYVITYSLSSEQKELGATFTDGSTGNKTHTYLITHKGLAIDDITIDYSAELANYSFAGWKILGDVTDTIYYFGNSFVPHKNTTFQAYFLAPDANTIDATIILKSGDGTNREDMISVTNTETYTFREDVWTSGTKVIYAWVDESGNEYYVGETFTVPLAIEQGAIYTFTALWLDKYTANFVLDANHQNATLAVRNVSVVKGGEYVLTSDNEPIISDSGVELSYWLYVDKYGNAIKFNNEEVRINIGDKIIFGADSFSYLNYADGTADYNLPSPTDSDNYGYYFLSVWNSKTIDITFHIVDESGNILSDYTFTKSVEYGTTLDTRGVLPSNVLALESDARGIVGWTTSNSDFTTAMPSILNNVSSELVLYSVWQSKLTLSFATGTNFDYTETIGTKYYLPTEDIDVNDYINKIYYVDSATTGDDNTVYYSDGKFLFVKQNNSLTTYYQLTGFAKSTGGSILLGNDYVLPKFTITENTVLTPIFTQVYKVSFYDNATSTGGEIVDSINPLYFATNTLFDIANSGITISRTGFTFGGWNTDQNGADGLASITIGSENINLYAIWNSSRSAIFRFKTGTNAYNTLFTISFNKDNKISSTLLDRYLSGEEFNGNLNPITSLQTLGHPAYSYNFNNWYLTGFGVNASTYSYEELIARTFTETSDVYITLNMEKIYTITFTKGSASGVSGQMPEDMFFVSLSDGGVGVMVDEGKFSTPLTLPTTLEVTKANYIPSAWATSESASATKYSLSTTAVNLSAEQLSAIATTLDTNNSSTYTLYLIWEYKKVSIAVYNLVDDDFDALVNPYDVYSLSTDPDGLDIPFDKTPTWVYVNGSSLLAGGVDNEWQTELPQVSYNSQIYFNLPTGFNNKVDGYRLIGFSTTLYKLGEVPESYYALGNTKNFVTINSGVILEGDVVKFYPVYDLITESVSITSTNGQFTYSLTSGLEVKGFVNDVDSYTGSASNYADIVIDKFSILTIVANLPVNGEYILDTINGIKVTTDTHLYGYNQGDNELFDGNQDGYTHTIEIVYSTRLLNISLILSYEVELNDGYEDTTNLGFDGTLADDTEFTIQLGKTYTSYTNALMYANDVIFYTINDYSQYYNYELYNNGEALQFYDHGQIRLDSLTSSDIQNPDGSYDTIIEIIAKPITHKVSFSMQLGTLKDSTVVTASNTVYKNITGFAIKNNVANVYDGSTIILPTADDITYVSGKFAGFSVNGDLDRNIITTHTVTSDIIFVENYDRNFFTVQYIYNGNSEQITGIAAGTEITINCDAAMNQDGLNFQYWGDENGNKLFDNGVKLTVNQNYILHAKYQGKELTLKYVYDGNTGRSITAIYGEKVTMLNGSELADATPYDDKYIYGWTITGVDETFVCGNTYEFNLLSSTYQSEITLNAIYMPRFKYTISYDSSNISNSGSLPTQYAYLHTSSADGSAYLINDLDVKLHTIAPISNAVDGETEQFSHYTLSISTDGSAYEPVEGSYVAGALLTLDAPLKDSNDADDKVYFFYKLHAEFIKSEESIEIEYVITNPTDSGRDSVTAQNTLATSTINILPDTILTDVYLPNNNVLEENSQTNFGSNSGDFYLAIKGTTIKITEDIDWNRYTLKGYKVELLGTNTTKEFIFGIETSRGVSGCTGIRMYPIWEDNFVISYKESDGTELTDLRRYIKYDTSESVILAENPGNLVEVPNSTVIGWSTSSSLDVITDSNYFPFGSEIEPANLILYPTHAKHYNINIVTEGVFRADESKFELGSVSLYTYYSNVLSFENKDFYNKSDMTNYSFVGYSLTTSHEDVFANNKYIFDYSHVDEENDTITIYAVWDKNSSIVTINFIARKNDISNTNVASQYTLDIKVYSGDSLDLYYDESTNKFRNKQLDETYQDIVTTYDYFTFGSFDVALTDNKLTPNGNIEITMTLKPVIRLVYSLDEDAEYNNDNGEFVSDGGIIKEGSVVTLKNPIANISHPNKLAKYWTMYGNSNFFDDNNEHLILNTDIIHGYLSAEYELVLYVQWETAYKVNLYYFANESDLKNNTYTPLYDEPISMELGDIIGYVDIDEHDVRSYTSVFDSDIANLNIANVSSLYDLLNMFAQYSSSTVYVNEDKQNEYGIWAGEYSETYTVISYTGDALVNDIYLVYTGKTYTISLATALAEELDGKLLFVDETINVMAEIALNDTQLNDNGTASTPSADQRQLVNSDETSLTLSFDDYIYIFNNDDWVRASAYSYNSYYNFIGWKMMVEDGVDGDGNIVYKFIDLTNLTLDTTENYIKLYNITSNAYLYAVFTEKQVEVQVTLTSSITGIDDLNAKVFISDNNADFSELSLTPNNNVLSFTVTYGQYIKFNDYDYTDVYNITKISIKDMPYVVADDDSINITSWVLGTNDKLYITIEYYIATKNIYFSTYVRDSANNEYLGTINKVGYKFNDIDMEASSIVSLSTPITKKVSGDTYSFDWNIAVEQTSILQSVDVLLNNYTITAWKYIDGSGKLVDVTDFTSIGEINSELYLVAVFEANDITIKYVVKDYDDNGDTKDVVLLQTTVKYGEYYTRPYIIYESNYVVTTGWTSGNWGTTALMVSSQNILDLSAQDFVIYANKINNYKLDFVNEYNSTQTFTPTYVASGVVSIDSGIEYTHITNYNNVRNEVTVLAANNTSATIFATTTAELPTTTSVGGVIDMGTSKTFNGWKSTYSTYTIDGTLVYKYDSRDITNATKHLIKLTALADSSKSITFVITNPTTSGANLEELKVYTNGAFTTGESNGITLVVDLENENSFANYINLTNSTNPNQWSLLDRSNKQIKNYFTNNDYIGSKYKLHGWAVTNSVGYEVAYESAQAVTLYNAKGSAVLKDSYGIISELWTLIAGGNYVFYPIWEEKVLVTFYDSTEKTNAIASGYYALGDVLDEPNPTTHNLDKESQKWTGWSGNRLTYTFVNNDVTITRSDAETTTQFVPKWEDGYTVTIDLNFDNERTDYGTIIQGYVSGVTADEITAKTGYPQYVGSDDDIVGSDVTSVNSKDYYTTYKYGSLWTAGTSLDLSALVDGGFSHEGIYYSYILTDNAGEIKDKYYKLVGWTVNGGEVVTDLSDLEIAGNVTLQAVWEGIDLTLSFYNDRAEKKFSHTIKFGQKLSEVTIDDDSNVATPDIPVLDFYGNKNEISKTGYRYSYWIAFDITNDSVFDDSGNPSGAPYGNNSVLSGNMAVITDMTLYPMYLQTFLVSFVNDDGVVALTTTENFISGEMIDVNYYLSQITDVNTISKVYYYDNYFTEVDITSYKEDNAGELEFIPENWTKDWGVKGGYVTIYYLCELMLNIYLPNSTDLKGAAVEHIPGGTAISIGSLISIDGDGNDFFKNVDTSVYVGNVKLHGWYYSPLSSSKYYSDASAYTLNESPLRYFQVVYDSENKVYKLNITRMDDSTEVIDIGNNLSINIYAKLTIETSVALGNGSEQIFNYASLEYDADTNKDYFKINGTNYVGSNVYKITYTSVYKSDYTPIFTINTSAGYVVSSVNGLSAFNDKTDNDIVYNGTFDLSSASSATDATLIRNLVNSTDVDMLFTHKLQLTSSTNSGASYSVEISVITYNVTYTYDHTVSSIRYKKTNNEYSFDYTEGNSYTHINSEYLYVSGNIINSYEVNFDFTDGKVEYTGIPYGTKLYVDVYPNNDMHVHFTEWEVVNNGLGETTQYTQLIKPNDKVENSTTHLSRNVAFNAQFAENEISAINLVLDVELDGENENNKPWENVLANAIADINTVENTVISQKDGKYYILIDTIEMNAKTYSLRSSSNNLKAGENIAENIALINESYHNAYNMTKGQRAGSKWTVASLLNYFLGRDTDINYGWFTYENSENERLEDDGVIYAPYVEGGTVVTLHKMLDKALLINIDSEVVDYENDSLKINVDRANVTLTGDYSGYYVFTGSNTNHNYTDGEQAETITVKMPFSNAISFELIPDGETSTHVAYELHEWIFNEIYSDNEGGGLGAITANQNIVSVNTSNSNISGAWSYYEKEGKPISIPDLKLRAAVKAVPYAIEFRSEGELISSKDVVYDEEVYNLDNDIYAKYSITLGYLYNNGILPRFELQPGIIGMEIPTFKHSEDSGARYYGQFKYIFSHWTNGTTELQLTDVLRNYDYSKVTLNANYESTNLVNIVLYTFNNGVKGSETYPIYLPATSLIDQFGNGFSSNILSVAAILLPFNSESGAVYDTYYVKGGDNSSHIEVNNMADILATGVNTIYPAVERRLTIYLNEVYASSDEISTMTLVTLGGKLDVDVVTSEMDNLYVGYLKLSNIVHTGDLTITYDRGRDYPGYSFAYWILLDDSEVSYLSSNGSYSYYSSRIELTAHYNPKIYFTNSAGSLTVTGNDGDANQWLRLTESIPSGVEIVKNGSSSTTTVTKSNVYITYDYFSEGAGGELAKAQAKVYRNGTLVYTVDYTAAYTIIAKVAFKVSGSGILLKTLNYGDTYYFEDNNGQIIVEAIGYPNEVTIMFENFAITNFEDYSNANSNLVGYAKTSGDNYVVDGATPITVENLSAYNYINGLSTDISFASDLVVTATGKNASMLNSNITNIRWQYMDTSGNWVDIDPDDELLVDYSYGSSKDSPFMKFRLACEWISSSVTFAKLSSTNRSSLGVDTIGGYNLNFNYSNYTLNSQTFEILKSESIEYNHATMTFTLSSSLRSDLNGTVIEVTNNSGYMHGWLEKTGSKVVGLDANTTYTDFNKGYYFYSWVEPATTITIKVDSLSASDFVKGYGVVNYQVIDPLRSSSSDYFEVNKSTEEYGAVTLGQSSVISLTGTADSSVGHKFEGFRLNGYGVGSLNGSINDPASDLTSTIYARFNAYNTLATYYVVNENQYIQTSITVYSGYEISHTDAGSYLSVVVKGIFGDTVQSFKIMYEYSESKAANTYYPDRNNKVGSVQSDYSLDSVTVSDNTITNSISGTNVIGQTITVKGESKPIVVKYSETITAVQVYVNVYNVTNGNSLTYGTAGMVTGYSSNVIYLDAPENTDLHYGKMRYDINVSGIELNMFENFVGNIVPVGDYTLKYAVLDCGDDTNDCKVDYPELVDNMDMQGDYVYENIVNNTCYLNIYVEERMTRTLYIYSTLPYAADLQRLNVSIGGVYGSSWSAGNLIPSGTFINSIDVPKNATMYTSVSGDNYTFAVSVGSTVYLYISYTLTPIYGSDSSTGFMVSTASGYNIKNETTRTSTSTMLSSYNVFDYDSSATDITSESVKDAAIILPLYRHTVSVIVDHDYFSKIASQSEDYWIRSYFNSDKASYRDPTIYSFPGGLGILWNSASENVGNDGSAFIGVSNLVKGSMYLKVEDTDVRAKLGVLPYPDDSVDIDTSYKYEYPGFMVISNANTGATDYPIDLYSSRLWAVLCMPMTSDIASVTFYRYHKSASSNESTTCDFWQGGYITLSTYIEGIQTSVDDLKLSQYANKAAYTALFEGLFDTDGGYYSKNIIFAPTEAQKRAWNGNEGILALTGYDIVVTDLDGKSDSFTVSRDEFNSGQYQLFGLGQYKSVSIYPIWDTIDVYHVEVVDNRFNFITSLSVLSKYVIAGDSYSIDRSLNEIQLDYYYQLKGLTKSFNTITVSSGGYTYVLMGFTSEAEKAYTINAGSLNLLNCNGESLTQDNSCSSGAYQMTLTPNSDITLTAVWEKVGYDVTYTKIGNEDKAGLLASDTESYSTCIEGMYYWPYYAYEHNCSYCDGGSHFAIQDYFLEYSAKTCVSQTSLHGVHRAYHYVCENTPKEHTDTVYYTLKHTSHCINKVLKYNGLTKDTSCYFWYEITCNYCDYSAREDLESQHDWKAYKYVMETLAEHYTYYACTRKCGVEDKKALENHLIKEGVEQINVCTTQKRWYCELCLGVIASGDPIVDHKSWWQTYKTYQEVYKTDGTTSFDLTKHIYDEGCNACGYHDDDNYPKIQDHTYEYLNIEKATSCIDNDGNPLYDQVTYYCPLCRYSKVVDGDRGPHKAIHAYDEMTWEDLGPELLYGKYYEEYDDYLYWDAYAWNWYGDSDCTKAYNTAYQCEKCYGYFDIVSHAPSCSGHDEYHEGAMSNWYIRGYGAGSAKLCRYRECLCTESGTCPEHTGCDYCSYKEYDYEHNWNKPANADKDGWIVSKKATCTTEGEKYRTCKDCNRKETEKISKTAHSYTTTYTWTVDDEGHHQDKIYACKYCGGGSKYKVTYDYDFLEHEFDYEEDGRYAVSDPVEWVLNAGSEGNKYWKTAGGMMYFCKVQHEKYYECDYVEIHYYHNSRGCIQSYYCSITYNNGKVAEICDNHCGYEYEHCVPSQIMRKKDFDPKNDYAGAYGDAPNYNPYD